MTQEQIAQFCNRIDKLTSRQKPLFGKTNANQMICHCTDQLRLAMGTIKAMEYGNLDPKEVNAMSQAGRTVPVPKGLGQVEGGGTKPTIFENDREPLKKHLLEFQKLPNDFNFGIHPYFSEIGKKGWVSIPQYHLGHHLQQFNNNKQKIL